MNHEVPPAPRVGVRRPPGVHPSLVDIMCCLVILFLLTSLLAVRTQQEARERTLPSVELTKLAESGGSAGERHEESPATLSIGPGPEYYFGERRLALRDLARALATRKPREVEIRGDAAVPHGAVMAAMRACQEAGVARVSMTYEVVESGVRTPLATTNP